MPLWPAEDSIADFKLSLVPAAVASFINCIPTNPLAIVVWVIWKLTNVPIPEGKPVKVSPTTNQFVSLSLLGLLSNILQLPIAPPDALICASTTFVPLLILVVTLVTSFGTPPRVTVVLLDNPPPANDINNNLFWALEVFNVEESPILA